MSGPSKGGTSSRRKLMKALNSRACCCSASRHRHCPRDGWRWSGEPPSTGTSPIRAAGLSRSSWGTVISRIRSGATSMWTSARNPMRRLRNSLPPAPPRQSRASSLSSVRPDGCRSLIEYGIAHPPRCSAPITRLCLFHGREQELGTWSDWVLDDRKFFPMIPRLWPKLNFLRNSSNC